MAGYAAGFSGLESFSPFCLFRLPLAASPFLARSIYPPTRELRLCLAPSRLTARGKAGREIERERRREKQVVRGFSVRETVQPPFNIVGAAPLPPPRATKETRENGRAAASSTIVLSVLIIGAASAK